VAPAGEIRYKVWAEPHQGIDQKVVDKGKSDNECKRCGMKKSCLEILSKTDARIGGISRASEAQTIVRICAKTTPPGSHCGR